MECNVLLRSKKDRVSRSVRVKWFIDYILNEGKIVRNSEDVMIYSSLECEQLASANVYYISVQYSFVFVIDMSSTMMEVNNDTFCVKVDEAISALLSILERLIRPVKLSDDDLLPRVSVSVVAYSGLISRKPVEVIVQGVHLNENNILEVLQLLKERLHLIENSAVNVCKKSDDNSGSKPDTTLESMIRIGILALQLLPHFSLKGLILITDGIGNFSNPTAMYNTVHQLRTSNISCWIVLCGCSRAPQLSLGSVPDMQTLSYIVESCNGCVLDPFKVAEDYTDTSTILKMTNVQKSMLLWSLQLSACNYRDEQIASVNSKWAEDPFVPHTLVSYHKCNISLPLMRLLGCRIREGYFIYSITREDSQIEFCLVFLWHPSIKIFYSIYSSWPVSDMSTLLLVNISFMAPYSFVHDFHEDTDTRCLSSYHSTMLKRLRQNLKSIVYSDTLLAHLLLFSLDSRYFNLSTDGTPLFTMSVIQSKPIVSVTSSVDDRSVGPSSFWKPLCTLDIKIWSRWFHTSKVFLVLNQDSPLPSNLLYPASSGRYSTLQFRVASAKLLGVLCSWASVVLLEAHTYLKFLICSGTPTYFCVVRMAQMHPCILLHIGFIEGTPHTLQQETISALRSDLQEMQIFLPAHRSIQGKKRISIPHRPCAVLLAKQLHKIIISDNIQLHGDLEGGDSPAQLQYLRKFKWQWQPHYRDPILLTALLRKRLQEGFVIARAHNGMITLVTELKMEQPLSLLCEPGLVQYVLYPMAANGVLTCEVWIEPQCVSVKDALPGMQYLVGATSEDIPFKIHAVDVEVLSQLSTFLKHCPSDTIAGDVDVSIPFSFDKSVQISDIPDNLAVLYRCAHLTTCTFSAFSEGITDGLVSLANSLHINVAYHKKLLELLQLKLSCKSILINNTGDVIKRLQKSHNLSDFVSLCESLQYKNTLLWRCLSVSNNEELQLVFVPCFLYFTNSQCRLPVAIMYVSLDNVLCNDPLVEAAAFDTTDLDYDFTYTSTSADASNSKLSGPSISICEKLRFIQIKAYLYAIHNAIRQGNVFSVKDLELCLNICKTALFEINLTPLVSAVCHHAVVEDTEGITLQGRLPLLYGEQNYGFKVSSCHSEVYDCLPREKDVMALFMKICKEKGFHHIDNMPGYYWFFQDLSDEVEKSQLDLESSSNHSVSLSSLSSQYSSDDEMDIMPILGSPTISIHPMKTVDCPPVFVRLMNKVHKYQVGNNVTSTGDTLIGINEIFADESFPLCLDKLSQDINQCKISMKMEVQVYSTFDESEISSYISVENENDMHGDVYRFFHPIIMSFKEKMEWLVQDELLSSAREECIDSDHVFPSVLQSVAAHVQSSAAKVDSCLFVQEPLKFVFGPNNSMKQFVTYLMDVNIPNYSLHKSIDGYMCFLPNTAIPSTKVSNLFMQKRSARFSTPSPPRSAVGSVMTHKRSVSWSVASHSTMTPLSNSNSINLDSRSEAHSKSSSSVSFNLEDSVTSVHSFGTLFWLVLKVMPHQVELYLHRRHSERSNAEDEQHRYHLCKYVQQSIADVCFKTNQWYLLKDMLDTRVCSSLLLPEAAWISEEEVVSFGEKFLSRQFECSLKWRQHITPHWRLKAQSSLFISRNALGAFAVSNRRDVYVIQDVLDNGEESIFYLKIHESLCEVEGLWNESAQCKDDRERCDTRTMAEGDTLSELSYVRSTADISEPSLSTQTSQQRAESTWDLAKPQESIVLDLCGISVPSTMLTKRLQRLIQLKLDDAALDMMCSSYTRNQRLKLSHADVQFLQPSEDQSSEMFTMTVPNWIPSLHAFLFYLLQNLSSVFLLPQYTSAEGRFCSFKVTEQLRHALEDAQLPSSAHQDFLHLYIRPVFKGRGMALICTTLFSADGVAVVPMPCVILPQSVLTLPSLKEDMGNWCSEHSMHSTKSPFIVFNVWERGNAGIQELRDRLQCCVNLAILDVIVEMYSLQQPVAVLSDEEVQGHLSPGLLSSEEENAPTQEGLTNMECFNGSSDREYADWQVKEKQHRLQECKDTLYKNAQMGQIGTLTNTYISELPLLFDKCVKLRSSIVLFHEWKIPSPFCTKSVLTYAYSLATRYLPGIALSIFRSMDSSADIFTYSAPDKLNDVVTKVSPSYIVVGRDLLQWKESRAPMDHTVHLDSVWSSCQVYPPLASWKLMTESAIPLSCAAKKHQLFIARHRLVLIASHERKFKFWSYNIPESTVKQIIADLSSYLMWQSTRCGLLQHLLCQKLGLFDHTNCQDIAASCKSVLKFCSTLDTLKYVVSTKYSPELIFQISHQEHKILSSAIDVERVYLDHVPSLPISVCSDPVDQHGTQFMKILKTEKGIAKQKELLGKVFVSWERRTIDSSAPISSEVIEKLKRTARVLHYCCTPLLLLNYVPSKKGISSRHCSGMDKDTIRLEFIESYTSYLQTLIFQPINERPPSVPQATSGSHIYKCLQRSWAGGIMLVELKLDATAFHVKLLSLESSRLSNRPHEVSGLFSQECGRMKDFIHVHSFTYDFHVRKIYFLIHNNIWDAEEAEEANLSAFLKQFCDHYSTPPNYIRNRLCTGQISVTTLMNGLEVYKHIVTHCTDYDLKTFELHHGKNTSSSDVSDVGLMINLCPSTIGPTTTPEISRILTDIQDFYDSLVVIVPIHLESHNLQLQIYMTLVNKTDRFPRLAVNLSPHQFPFVENDDNTEKQSQLHCSIRTHRRKLGYGSLSSPSAASQLVVNSLVISEHVSALQVYLKNIIKAAQCHLQRNKLWKRLLYGGIKSEAVSSVRPSKFPMKC